MSDCLIVGGGVIGLSLAYELAGHGLKVRLIDAGQPGREASWAGAGILPPAGRDSDDPLEQLTALSNSLHVQWSADLLASTGNDNGFRRSGAIYLARDVEEAGRLEQFASLAESRGITAERLSAASLVELEAALLPQGTVEAAYHVPDECQIRNPRHLKALLIGCATRRRDFARGLGRGLRNSRRSRQWRADKSWIVAGRSGLHHDRRLVGRLAEKTGLRAADQTDPGTDGVVVDRAAHAVADH